MNIEEVLAGARDSMTVQRVFGEPIERGGMTIIPVAKISGGGGGGGGTDEQGSGGSGGGYGVSAKPVGVYVIRDGTVSWQPAVDVNRVIIGGQVVMIVLFLMLRALIKSRSKS